MTTTLYGIKNCDSVKKARHWLDANGIPYQFHDFRSDGITTEQINLWLTQLGAERILNKRSTSWRNLTEEQKQDLSDSALLPLLKAQPTLIKRPVLVNENIQTVGFSPKEYEKIFPIASSTSANHVE
jgi:arsenate reductase